jgi:thioredoxin-dependent peroxiredoxin
MDILFHGETVQLIGEPLEVGKKLPDFQLTAADGRIIEAHDLYGKLTLISVVPDLNTRVCSLSTRKFNKTTDQYPQAKFITISTNAPEDQKNWCALEGVKSVEVLSDQDKSFGKAMNLYIPANDRDTRAIYVINDQGIVIYRELISNISNEPNYEAALNAVEKNIE